MDKFRSYTIKGKYRTSPPNAQVHKDAENIQEFETLELLQASPEYITQIALQNDGFNQDEVNWMASRDEILDSAYVAYKGFYVDMSPSSQAQFTKVRDTLSRRNKKANWKALKISTGKYMRVQIGRDDIDAISDAVFDASQIIHEAADTGFPVNPWPLEVS